MTERVFRVLYERIGTFLSYDEIAQITGIGRIQICHKVRTINKWQGVNLEFSKKKVSHWHCVNLVKLISLTNKAYRPSGRVEKPVITINNGLEKYKTYEEYESYKRDKKGEEDKEKWSRRKYR